MLRIIAGELKSRLFKAPSWHKIHPMSDRARMALFNMLGDLSQVRLVLDAYGGSGALAFEALSRGAQQAVIMEIENRIYRQLSENVIKLGLSKRVKTYRANNATCLQNLEQNFDLIFLDPPFANPKAEALIKIASFLTTDGRLVLSHPPHFKSPFQTKDWICLNDKQYAQLHLKIYARA